MIIEKAIQLELEHIEIRENPMNQNGKYVCYQFRMSYPSSYSFFKVSKTVGAEDFSIIWGTSPTIEFLDKGHKEFSAMILPKIIADLPPDFKKEHIGRWYLNTKPSPKRGDDSVWGCFYDAETYHNKDRVSKLCQRHILLGADFMSGIISRLPIEITGLKVIRP